MTRTAIVSWVLVTLCCITFQLPLGAQCPPQPNCSTPLLPLQPEMTVSTVSSALPGGFGPFVVIVTDTRNPAVNAPGLDMNWYAPTFSNEIAPTTTADEWSATNLGEVFGICLDEQPNPNIYVAATALYSTQGFGPGGGGGIYKLDGTTGDICLVATLPNSGAALGNICFDSRNGQFFAADLDDGLIYRLVGAELLCQPNMPASIYDHGVDGRTAVGDLPIPDDATLNVTQLGRRVFAVQKHPVENRLYYSVWWEDYGNSNLSEDNQVWSVGLDAAGDFVPGSAVHEFTVPPIAGFTGTPVLDIAFDPGTCEMLIAERTLYGPIAGTSAHSSRVLAYSGSSSAWVPAACPIYDTGLGGGSRNAAGGVAVDCAGNTWATSDYIHPFSCDLIYGLHRIDAGGNCGDTSATSNGYLLDLDCDTTSFDKTRLGDVEIVNDNCPTCANCVVNVDDVQCGENGEYSVSLTISNNSGVDAERVKLVPLGGFSFMPDTYYVTVPSGGSTTVNPTLIGAASGVEICFEVWLLDENLAQCCVTTVCITPPSCCLCIIDPQIDCLPDGTFAYTFTLENKFDVEIDRIFLWPDPPGSYTVSPDEFVLGTPVPTGGNTGPLGPVIISGPNPGDTICLEFTIHNSVTGECCGEKITITLPDCDPCDIPDECNVPEVVQFCQNGDELTADIVLTLCNNCSASGPVTYQVDFDGVPSCGDVDVLTPASFVPNNLTTVVVNPGECIDIPVTITAFFPNIMPGQCTCFQVRITNLVTGVTFICEGTACFPQPGAKALGPLNPVVTDTVVAVTFDVENLTSNQLTFEYVIAAFNPGQTSPPAPISLDGLPPGEPVRREVGLEPLATEPVVVDVGFALHDPFNYYQLYFLADLDGDGVEEAQAVASLKSVINVDCNMNGVPDDIDILIGTSSDADGDGVPDECGGIPFLPEFLRGDANADVTFDISDPIFALDYMFLGGATPQCLSAADANGDGVIEVDDVLCMLSALFGNGPDPAPPFPTCEQSDPGPMGCGISSCET